MTTRHLTGNEPSPRRGFTLVGSHAATTGPVVVRVDGSEPGLRALRAGAEMAMTRSCPMVVVGGRGRTTELGEREQSAVDAILRNPNVQVVAAAGEDMRSTMRRCRRLGATMLVLGQTDVRDLETDPSLLEMLGDQGLDLLVVAGQSSASSATNVAGSSLRSEMR